MRTLVLLLFALLVFTLPLHAAEPPAAAPLDTDALAGLKSAKAVFDMRIGEPKPLLFALKVVEETAAGMRAQGVEPQFVLAFRGSTLLLLKSMPEAKTEADQAILAEVRERLAELRKQGMVLEACNVAARVFKVEGKDLDPSLHLIGNSIVSLIGYQHQGYALVPMY